MLENLSISCQFIPVTGFEACLSQKYSNLHSFSHFRRFNSNMIFRTAWELIGMFRRERPFPIESVSIEVRPSIRIGTFAFVRRASVSLLSTHERLFRFSVFGSPSVPFDQLTSTRHRYRRRYGEEASRVSVEAPPAASKAPPAHGKGPDRPWSEPGATFTSCPLRTQFIIQLSPPLQRESVPVVRKFKTPKSVAPVIFPSILLEQSSHSHKSAQLWLLAPTARSLRGDVPSERALKLLKSNPSHLKIAETGFRSFSTRLI